VKTQHSYPPVKENNRPEALAAGILACILLFTGVCVCCTNPAATSGESVDDAKQKDFDNISGQYFDPTPKGITTTDAVGGPEIPSPFSIQPQPKGYYGPIR
jgi:hypothetical protein